MGGFSPSNTSAVLVLATCDDLAQPLVVASLRRLAVGAGGNYALHIVSDDAHCPGTCASAVPSTFACLERSALGEAGFFAPFDGYPWAAAPDGMTPSPGAPPWWFARFWAWEHGVPLALSQAPALRAAPFVWLLEVDVAYTGDWGSLLARYYAEKPTVDLLAQTAAYRCGLPPAEPAHPKETLADMRILPNNETQPNAPNTPSTAIPACYGLDPDLTTVRFGNLFRLMKRAPERGAWKALLFASRLSRRLVDAGLQVHHTGGRAVSEIFWPQVCMSQFGGEAVGGEEEAATGGQLIRSGSLGQRCAFAGFDAPDVGGLFAARPRTCHELQVLREWLGGFLGAASGASAAPGAAGAAGAGAAGGAAGASTASARAAEKGAGRAAAAVDAAVSAALGGAAEVGLRSKLLHPVKLAALGGDVTRWTNYLLQLRAEVGIDCTNLTAVPAAELATLAAVALATAPAPAVAAGVVEPATVEPAVATALLPAVA